MKVLFISPSCENMGMEYLSAALKQAGHQVDLVYDPQLFNDTFVFSKTLSRTFSHEKRILKEVGMHQPDLVAFSVVSDNYSWACQRARKIKEIYHLPIIFGGVHPSSVPEVVMKNEFADYVVVGEGEGAIVDLANSLDRGEPISNIRNLWYKENGSIKGNEVRPPIQNLDELPFPDKDLFYAKLPFFRDGYYIMTSRGCVYRCTYCNNSLFKRMYAGKGPFFRRRSVENVLNELKEAKKKYNMTSIHFWDEIFVSDHDWLKEFLERYRREIALPYACCIHVNFIKEDVVSLLKKSGCWQAFMGVQSLNEDIKKNILHRNETNERVKETIRLFNQYRISIVAENIINLPNEKEDDLVYMMKFYNENRPTRLYVFWLSFYPKTEIVDIAHNMGILDEKAIEDIENRKNTKPFQLGGTIENKQFEKCQTMLALVNKLPRRLNDFLIRKKVYRFFPSSKSFYHSLVRVMDREKRFDISAYRITRVYWLFMFKKLKGLLYGM
jgi:radical SAM superfamily enzyme YgiQ (UPF0313 family)